MNSGDRNEKVARMFKLWGSVGEMVVQGKREPDPVNEFLQGFVFGGVLPNINWQLTYRKLNMEREYEAALKVLPTVFESPSLWVVPMISHSSNKVVAAFKRDGVNVYQYQNNLDAGIKHERDTSKGPYFMGFCRTVEADEENKGKSANVLAQIGHKGSTLPERMYLGYGYFVTTDKHLDIKCITLCSGSRCSCGGVPGVGWSSGGAGVDVDWYFPGNAYDNLRSRSAISCGILPA